MHYRTYLVICFTACGGLFALNRTRLSVTPPYLPGVYPSDLRCAWYIHTTFSNFSNFIYVTPKRMDYNFVCHNYNLYATGATSTRTMGSSVNLCLGRMTMFWTVHLRSPILIHFSMKHSSRVRPNIAVELSSELDPAIGCGTR